MLCISPIVNVNILTLSDIQCHRSPLWQGSHSTRNKDLRQIELEVVRCEMLENKDLRRQTGRLGPNVTRKCQFVPNVSPKSVWSDRGEFADCRDDGRRLCTPDSDTLHRG